MRRSSAIGNASRGAWASSSARRKSPRRSASAGCGTRYSSREGRFRRRSPCSGASATLSCWTNNNEATCFTVGPRECALLSSATLHSGNRGRAASFPARSGLVETTPRLVKHSQGRRTADAYQRRPRYRPFLRTHRAHLAARLDAAHRQPRRAARARFRARVSPSKTRLRGDDLGTQHRAPCTWLVAPRAGSATRSLVFVGTRRAVGAIPRNDEAAFDGLRAL